MLDKFVSALCTLLFLWLVGMVGMPVYSPTAVYRFDMVAGMSVYPLIFHLIGRVGCLFSNFSSLYLDFYAGFRLSAPEWVGSLRFYLAT